MGNKTKNIDDQSEQQIKIRNVNVEHKESLKPLDRMALWVADKVGSVAFFAIIFLWTSSWMCWNIFAPSNLKFDPSPTFNTWLFFSNLIQIFLMPLIMIGQNLQSKHSEARAEADFEINTKAEMEIRKVLEHLENQNRLILQLLGKNQAGKIRMKTTTNQQ